MESIYLQFDCHILQHAITTKCKSKGESREHWLDYASDKYEVRLPL